MRVHTVLGAAVSALVAAACLAPAASAADDPAPVLAVNAGGAALTSGGVAYSADRYASGGTATTSKLASGPYQTLRFGMSGYDLPVANGTYDVTLQFVENYWTAAGKRVFDVTAEGARALTAVDPYAAAGGKDKAVTKTIPVTVADGKLTLGFTASKDKPSVAGVVVRRAAAATPVPTPVATPTTPVLQRASWTAPTLVNPLVWTPSASKRTFSAPADRDVLIQWPSTALDVQGGFELMGGRNVVSKGGTVKFSKRYFASMEDKPNNNRCLKISGNAKATVARTVHVEGLHCAGAHVWEGINVDSQGERGTLTVQLRDIKMDGVNVEFPGGGKHIGGDALQVWNGPHRLRVDGFTAKNLEYQGFYLQPYQFGSGKLGAWDIRNVNLEGASAGSAYLMWLAGSRNAAASDGVAMTVKDVYVQPGGSRTRSQTLWDATNDWSEVKIGKPVCDFVL